MFLRWTAAARDRPVAELELLVRLVEESAVGAGEREAGEAQIVHGVVRSAALHPDEFIEFGGLDVRRGEIGALRRVEIELAGRFVVEPLAGGVEFLEDVLHHAVRGVQAAAAVVVTHPVELRGAVGLQPGHSVGVAAPLPLVQASYERGGGVLPAGGSLRRDGVGRVAAQDGGLRVVVGVAGEDLAFPVQEETVEVETRAYVGDLDGVVVRVPLGPQRPAAADDDAFTGCREVADRGAVRAGVFRAERQGVVQAVGARVHHDVDGSWPVFAHLFAGGFPGALHCAERPGRRAVGAIVAGGRHVEGDGLAATRGRRRGGRGGGAEAQRDTHRRGEQTGERGSSALAETWDGAHGDS